MSERVFKAWTIFWTLNWNGKTMPLYKNIPGKDFPWFRTKKEAEQFLRSIRNGRKRHKSDPVTWSIKRIKLTMEMDNSDLCDQS